MNAELPTLPLPLIGALILTWLGLRAARSGTHGRWFLALIGLCVWQSAVIALHHHYGVRFLRPVQPLGAVLIPPMAWIALTVGSIRPLRAVDGVHLGPVAGVAVLLAVWPLAIDGLILLTFAGYGVAILWRVRRGADALPFNRLQVGETAARLWRLIGAGLILSALSEALIVAAFALDHPSLVGWIIGGYAAGSLLAIGALSLSSDLTTPQAPRADTPPAEPTQDADDAALVARLTELMRTQALHRDPDLTLARLARRMARPAKTLSAAINRHTSENVSRLINTWRINDACAKLNAGVPVTQAMLDAGFNTKSNFNREFKRVTGLTPSDWRQKGNR